MTSPTSNQRDRTTGPQFVPLRYRLHDVADIAPLDGHLKLGGMFQADDCSFPLQTSTVCVTGALGLLKVPNADANWRGFNTFVLRSWVDCALVGSNLEELRERTLRAHNNNAKTVAESVFWNGGVLPGDPYFPHLAEDLGIEIVSGGSEVTLQSAAVVITGTHDVVEALGRLEQAMAGCYGGTPIIHVPRGATAHLSANYLVESDGTDMRTANGSDVVPGPGYGRTGPDGIEAPDGFAWFYATGRVKIWESSVQFTARDEREVMVRATNDTVLIAEQWFGVAWDCCHFAILVNLGGVITGAIGSAT